MGNFRMYVKKNTKKKRNNKRSGGSKPVSYKKTLFIFSSLLIVVIVFTSFYALFAKSRYFIVQNVIMIGKEPNSSINYAELEKMIKGENIFKVNSDKVRSYMLNNYRELLDLRFKKAFPDSIIATIILRKPAAELYQRRYYPIDKDGVILSDVKDCPDGRLPIIKGVRFNPEKEIGKITDSKRVKGALLLVDELNKSGVLKNHTLVEIDVASLRNIIFFLEDGMEVKIGRDHFTARLKNLKEILSDPKLKPADIRYIDLRFKEPVIGPKWKR